jgi:hypothetical protein
VEDRKREVEKRLSERRGLREQIVTLSKQRTEYIKTQRAKQSGAGQNSFDVAVANALKEQLARKGIK